MGKDITGSFIVGNHADTSIDTLDPLRCQIFEDHARTKIRLDPASKRILFAMLTSPKTPAEVSRIYGIPGAVVGQKVARLQELGLLRRVFVYVDATGTLRRYFEAVLPVDESEDERELVVQI
jgi:hypothetical protein